MSKLSLKSDSSWFFIQIGAHDGVSFDPICRYARQYNWRGILVEPQPKVFERLVKARHQEKNLFFENAAIGKTDGESSLFAFRENPSLPYHATMLASFNRRALEKNTHGYNGEIEELKVPTLSVATLLAKHSVKHVDFLQIDTEGFDMEIIKMFMEADVWPTVIHFEDTQGLVSANEWILSPLARRGYAFFHLFPDTLAYRQTEDLDFRRRTMATQRDMEALVAPS
jgi:FkbM family methyltransferase